MELDAIVVGPRRMIFFLPENIVVYRLGFTFMRASDEYFHDADEFSWRRKRRGWSVETR